MDETKKVVQLSEDPGLTVEEGHTVVKIVDTLCYMRSSLDPILDRLYKCSDCSLALRQTLYALRCGSNVLLVAIELLQNSFGGVDGR